MLMLGLYETSQLTASSSVHWYGGVLWTDDGDVLWTDDGDVLWTEDRYVLWTDDGHVL